MTTFYNFVKINCITLAVLKSVSATDPDRRFPCRPSQGKGWSGMDELSIPDFHRVRLGLSAMVPGKKIFFKNPKGYKIFKKYTSAIKKPSR
jgi:hypothetical protein